MWRTSVKSIPLTKLVNWLTTLSLFLACFCFLSWNWKGLSDLIINRRLSRDSRQQENNLSDNTEKHDKSQWLKTMELKYLHFNQHIKQTCQRYFEEKQDVNRSESKQIGGWFMISNQHRLAFCRVAKVGSTTWLTHFTRLNLTENNEKMLRTGNIYEWHSYIPGMFAPKNQLNLKDDATPEVLDRYFLSNPHFRFTFARHPFDRILSAHRDKIMSEDDKGYGPLRNKVKAQFGSLNLTSFVGYVVKNVADYRRCRRSHAEDSCFVDAHWRPLLDQCAHCNFDYDVIGRVETMAEDTKYIFIKQNLTNLIPLNMTDLKLHSVSKYSEQSIDGSESSPDLAYIKAKASTIKALSSLGNFDLLQKLYDTYRVDFELFKYSLDGFQIEKWK